MGFYYGSNKPDPGKEKAGSLRETLAIIVVVFRVLALPLGILFGVIAIFFLIFFAFALSPFAGLGLIGLGIGALVARGIWEAKHPPEIR